MKEKLKKIVPDKYKIIINKTLKPIKFLQYVLNKNEYLENCERKGLNFYTDVEVVNKIIEEKKSLSRFGDGEFLWILNVNHRSYQKLDETLSQKLRDVLTLSNENLILAVPNVYSKEHLNKYKLHSKMHWVNFGYKF